MTIPSLARMVLYIFWMIYSWMFKAITWRKARGFIKLLEHFRTVETSKRRDFANTAAKRPRISLVPP